MYIHFHYTKVSLRVTSQERWVVAYTKAITKLDDCLIVC